MSNTGHTTDASPGARKAGWRRRHTWGRLLLWLLTPPAAIAVAFQLQPTHVVLDIPVTSPPVVTLSGKRPRYFWWEEQRSQLAYPDRLGVLYLRRLVGTGSPDIQGWQTAEDVFKYFDRWLSAHGWTYSGSGTPMGVQAEVPEGRFLRPDQSRRYYRTNDWSIRAVVSVWPRGEGFYVVLTTKRPSWAAGLRIGCEPGPSCEPDDFE